MGKDQDMLEAIEGHISGQSNEPISQPAHALAADEVEEQLKTSKATGLSEDEASIRLTRYGLNVLRKEKGVRPLEILVAQVVNAMIVVLLLALAASFAIQAWVEGGVLAGIILINLVIGFFQDLQAARTISSLDSLNSPTARVIRGGESRIIDVADLVPGDVIELKTGDSVPADARVFDAVNLEADEALLTGESLPARKDPQALHEDDDGAGDRTNIVFASTVVTKGRGRAIIHATGMFTEIGAIAAALQASGGEKRKVERDENGKASTFAHIKFATLKVWDHVGEFLGLTVGTPLQKKLSALFLYIFLFAIVCAIIVLGANNFADRQDVIIYAVATALGTLPVTLILVLTITMAAGTKVMVQRHVLVRNMRSLEALGGVTNICSDKTGTLTQGKMVVRMAWLPSAGTYSIETSNEPYNPEAGSVSFTAAQPSELNETNGSEKSEQIPEQLEKPDSALSRYLDVAAFANLATVKKSAGDDPEASSQWQAQGDPTEIAIQVFASRFGRKSLSQSESSEWMQQTEFPFDSSVKKMSVLCLNNSTNETHIFTKGAVERVLETCSTAVTGSDSIPLTEQFKSDVLANMEALARRGLRVLALADGRLASPVCEDDIRTGQLRREDYERDLNFLGLIGIYDPPRPESRPSVFKCHQAGISVHMLTGDHPETARTIAGEVGILPSKMEMLPADIARGMVMTAHDFDKLSSEEIDQLPQLPLVVARCAPNTKVRMIDALHRRGRYVAMTGDGVNDSPSLRRADVGIAMGLNGSDVAKSASDIVLSDDNFASILNAVEEGRRIFDNVQKFILHVLAANVGFVLTLLIGLIHKDESGVSVFQVSPVEILFMLLIAGAFTETGLGFESASPDILNRPPQSLKYGVFTPEFCADLVVYGLFMAASLLTSFVIVLFGFYDGELGHDCNREYSPRCEGVFRARSTCYTSMMWIFLFFAWELVESRRSFFDGIISDTKGWALRLWRNKFLFWSVVGGFFIVFPTLYIPVLNRDVFLHAGIDKEWGISFYATVLFFMGCESWKWAKRVYLRRKNLMHRDVEVGEEELEKRVFGRYYESTTAGQESS